MYFPVLWRRVVAALCLACVSGAAVAQDPNVIAAQTAARQWLVFIDRGDAQASWGAAGKKFQSAISVAVWVNGLKKTQARLGTATRRTAGPARFGKTLPGFPDGEYAQILFKTSFANKANSRESLSMEREADGKWRVIGYLPQ
jgi:hypothetical protein